MTTRFFVLLALAATTVSAQKADLTVKFKKGEKYSYREENTQTVTAEGMPGGGQKATSLRLVSYAVKSVDKQGTAVLLRSVDSSSTMVDEKPMTDSRMSKMDGIVLKVTMAKNGKILDAVPAEEVKDEQTKKMVDMMSGQYKQSPTLPGKVVDVGETWNDEITNNTDTPMGKLTITMKMTTKFSGVEELDGVEVAVLDVAGTMSGELGAGMGVITGTIKGKRYFAHREGRERKMELVIDQNMDMQTPQGNMMMQTKMQQERTLLR